MKVTGEILMHAMTESDFKFITESPSEEFWPIPLTIIAVAGLVFAMSAWRGHQQVLSQGFQSNFTVTVIKLSGMTTALGIAMVNIRLFSNCFNAIGCK